MDTSNCTICKVQKRDPRAINCGHSFCKACLKDWLRYCTENQLDKKCPICEEIIKDTLIELYTKHNAFNESNTLDSNPEYELLPFVTGINATQPVNEGTKEAFENFLKELDVLYISNDCVPIEEHLDLLVNDESTVERSNDDNVSENNLSGNETMSTTTTCTEFTPDDYTTTDDEIPNSSSSA